MRSLCGNKTGSVRTAVCMTFIDSTNKSLNFSKHSCANTIGNLWSDHGAALAFHSTSSNMTALFSPKVLNDKLYWPWVRYLKRSKLRHVKYYTTVMLQFFELSSNKGNAPANFSEWLSKAILTPQLGMFNSEYCQIRMYVFEYWYNFE